MAYLLPVACYFHGGGVQHSLAMDAEWLPRRRSRNCAGLRSHATGTSNQQVVTAFRSRIAMSAPGGRTDLPFEWADFRFRPRLCENSREPRTRRIAFSIRRLATEVPMQFVCASMKLRQIFYTQIELRTFHTVWTQRRHRRLASTGHSGSRARPNNSVFRAQRRFDALDQPLPQRRHRVAENGEGADDGQIRLHCRR